MKQKWIACGLGYASSKGSASTSALAKVSRIDSVKNSRRPSSMGRRFQKATLKTTSSASWKAFAAGRASAIPIGSAKASATPSARCSGHGL